MPTAEQLIDQLLESWQINNRIHLYMLDAIPPEALDGVSLSKGRSVAAMFAHIHNVRLMWLKSAAPELLDTVTKIEPKQPVTKDDLRTHLEASSAAVVETLRRGFGEGRIKGFKPHPAAFLGNLMVHEGYHRGEIGIVLTQSGHPLPEKISYGLWEWGAR